eukprot:TRINITY_DN91154_c0_g1_i1.p1 TRINITY_DN91154_c0_g1~~TRINITY_DN91154_c0_g1_i1.p1  ORF type:complete len:192 (-),score=46.61 TRINITY_DN91154_c0_g1_i1:44-619(-)
MKLRLALRSLVPLAALLASSVWPTLGEEEAEIEDVDVDFEVEDGSGQFDGVAAITSEESSAANVFAAAKTSKQRAEPAGEEADPSVNPLKLMFRNSRGAPVYLFWSVPDGPRQGDQDSFGKLRPGGALAFNTMIGQTWFVRAGASPKSQLIRRVVTNGDREQNVEVTNSIDYEEDADEDEGLTLDDDDEEL